MVTTTREPSLNPAAELQTASPSCGDSFVLRLDHLAWGGERAYLFGTEVDEARTAVLRDDVDACRRIFDAARGSY